MGDRWVEEYEYFSGERRAQRKERKRASSKDKSKYKKTDMDKAGPQSVPEGEFRRGRVISIRSLEIVVDSDGEQVICTLRGVLKKERSRQKNLVVVGDNVLFEDATSGEGVIVYVEERYSWLSRSDSLEKRNEQCIAANIDQVIITTSLLIPPLKPALIDRYIISTLRGNMEPVIVFNKIDLTSESDEEAQLLEECRTLYTSLGFPVVLLSAISCEGLPALYDAMNGKASVFAGQSGVGKSSLINAVAGLSLPIGDTGRARKGIHTTTTASLVPLPFGGWCIDTPGVRSFGMWNLSKEDLQRYFPEIDALRGQCKYPNCTHVHEPGCILQQEIDEKKISSLRYNSYISLLEEIETEQQQ